MHSLGAYPEGPCEISWVTSVILKAALVETETYNARTFCLVLTITFMSDENPVLSYRFLIQRVVRTSRLLEPETEVPSIKRAYMNPNRLIRYRRKIPAQPLLSEAHGNAIRRTWKTELPVRAKIVLEAKGEPLLLQLMLPDLSTPAQFASYDKPHDMN
ncbi:hypothetical protein M513_13449 [Trichuris suis]|uniref:Uncharacterized protein n=1 Tax=Trichuris suis TaxID=68888 RepID=A0A085LL31_9BILA|nr:hypothetical protein M513_13449 [Trichuris suis]